jgi:hypothetical protein
MAASSAHERKAESREEAVVRKIHQLSPELLSKLETTLDRLLETADAQQDLVLQEFGRSREVLAGIWDNPDDAEYDRL